MRTTFKCSLLQFWTLALSPPRCPSVHQWTMGTGLTERRRRSCAGGGEPVTWWRCPDGYLTRQLHKNEAGSGGSKIDRQSGASGRKDRERERRPVFHTWLCYVETERHSETDAHRGGVPTVWTQRRRRFLGKSAHRVLGAQYRPASRRHRTIVPSSRFQRNIAVKFEREKTRRDAVSSVYPFRFIHVNPRSARKMHPANVSLAWVLRLVASRSLWSGRHTRGLAPKSRDFVGSTVRAYGPVTVLPVPASVRNSPARARFSVRCPRALARNQATWVRCVSARAAPAWVLRRNGRVCVPAAREEESQGLRYSDCRGTYRYR